MTPAVGVLVGLATIYFPGDHHNSGIRADGRPLGVNDHHIAHRALPLGTPGLLCSSRTGWCTFVTVRDRGPYGVLRPCRNGSDGQQAKRIRWKRRCHFWAVQARRRKGWTYRGEFDLTRSVARAVGHCNFDVTYLIYWRRPKQAA